MTLKRLRQILKALADDTRLRIVNILMHRELTVNEICSILRINQPTISKHLVRLRLLGIVFDKRVKNYVYYSLNLNADEGKIIRFITSTFKDLNTFEKDEERLKKQKIRKI